MQFKILNKNKVIKICGQCATKIPKGYDTCPNCQHSIIKMPIKTAKKIWRYHKPEIISEVSLLGRS